MACTRILLLQKIVKIQEITIREQKRGASQQWIYDNIIREAFYISKPTYDRYLARNAKKELNEYKLQNEQHE